MSFVYCSKCGTRSPLIPKAIKSMGRVIDLVEPHECVDPPLEFDLKPLPVPSFIQEPKGKFVENLNQLKPKGLGMQGTGDLRDRRRPEFTKSLAPQSILDEIKNLQNSEPENPPGEEPSDV